MKGPQAVLEKHLQAIRDLVRRLENDRDFWARFAAEYKRAYNEVIRRGPDAAEGYWEERANYWKDAYYDALDGVVLDDKPSVGDS